MLGLPPIPTWDALHPLIIHFPIALLLVAPLFVLIGAVLKPEQARSYFIVATIMMALGTTAVFVAVETGEAAGKLAERTPEINAVLSRHEALAERTRATFSVLTAVFIVITGLTFLAGLRGRRWLTTAVPIVFLFFYGFGALLLVNTAHRGGTLVHQYGVHALIGEPAPATGQQGE